MKLSKNRSVEGLKLNTTIFYLYLVPNLKLKTFFLETVLRFYCFHLGRLCAKRYSIKSIRYKCFNIFSLFIVMTNQQIYNSLSECELCFQFNLDGRILIKNQLEYKLSFVMSDWRISLKYKIYNVVEYE